MRLRAATASTLLLGVLTFSLIAIPSSVPAHSADPTFKGGFDRVAAEGTKSGIKSFASLSDFILAVLAVVGALIAVIALMALMIGAVMYIISLGDEGKTEKAKKIIIYAVVGLLVLGGAGILVNVLINLIKK